MIYVPGRLIYISGHFLTSGDSDDLKEMKAEIPAILL